MRSDWCSAPVMDYILSALMPANRLVMEVCLATGLRIGDVLSLETANLQQRMTITERKTQKKIRVYLPKKLFERMRAGAGKIYVFSSPRDPNKARTRQAVWLDVKRASALFRIKVNVTPHSARKLYAVEELNRSGDLLEVQRKLNHSDPTVTMLYALADQLGGKLAGRKPRRS